MRFQAGAALAALSVMLAACGGGGGGDAGNTGGTSPPPQNSAPTFGALAFSTTEDTDLSARLTATDADGDAITFAQTGNPANGTVVSFDPATGQLTYRPNANASGADSFAVRATDAGGRVTNATVAITVSAVNDAPTATANAVATDQAIAATSRIVATDLDGDALSYTIVRNVSSGTLSFVADGSFTYQPNPQFTGNDSFEVDVTDAQGASFRVAVPIIVAPSALVHAGVQTQVVIREDNAAPIAKGLLNTFTRFVAISERGAVRPVVTPPATVDVLQTGETAGTARITGEIDAAGNGTLQIIYTDFARTAGTTFNGLEILEIDTSTNSLRRTYKGTSVSVDGTSMTVSGSLLRRPNGVGISLQGSLVLGMPDGSTAWVRDADLSYRSISLPRPLISGLSTIEWNGAARIYDAVLGYSDVQLDGGFYFQRLDTRAISGISRPVGRGSIAATGAAQARLWLTPISPYTFAIELDLAARGRPEKALAFRRRDDFTVPTGSDASHRLQAAVAMPFDRVYGQVGVPFFPEGRFSEHRDGTFLTHRWFIDVAPPGSTAQLSLADTPRPTFTPDRGGEYLLRLEVAAGTATSTDYLVVKSYAAGQTPHEIPPLHERPIPGASDAVDVGEEVTLDARKSYTEFPDPLTLDYRWTVTQTDPTGTQSVTVLNAVPGGMIRFTPAAPGRYQAVFHRPDTTSASFVTKTFTVRPLVRFAPLLRLSAIAANRPFVMDLDGDGHQDIFGLPQSVAPMILHRGRAGGGFEDGVNLTAFTYDTAPLWFEDLTGDGRLEAIRTSSQSDQVTVAVQMADGQFAAAVPLDNGPTACSTSAYFRSIIGSVDIDRNGRNDLIRSQLCNDGNHRMIVYMSTASGFAAGQELALPGGLVLSRGTSGDIDGDGDRDLVGAPAFSGSLPSTAFVLRLNAAGTFDSTSIPLSEQYTPSQFAIRDFNNDGRADILVPHDPVFLLTQDAGGSFAETATFPVSFPNYEGWTSLPAGDFTGDGLLDLVLTDNATNLTRLWTQQPNGTFLPRPVINGALGSYLDLNGDGLADVVGGSTYLSITAPQ